MDVYSVKRSTLNSQHLNFCVEKKRQTSLSSHNVFLLHRKQTKHDLRLRSIYDTTAIRLLRPASLKHVLVDTALLKQIKMARVQAELPVTPAGVRSGDSR